ncbi:DUF2207 domain-containing protein, partial [Candidatus Dependentiae bacterium]|nr:DUF2207 domain-containing protein [Candidatus Dependentiae bacterium]
MKKIITLTFIHLYVLLFAANAAEYIEKFTSFISIHEDGSITVKEEITVQAENIKIKRGIYRDFPTKYPVSFGLPFAIYYYNTPFEIISILKNDLKEPYHIVNRDNGIRIYIGENNHFLENKKYTYTIEYKTSRQLGHFKNHDELYWNVTGNNWEFPISSAAAYIKLPKKFDAKILEMNSYTGRQGSKESDCKNSLTEDNLVNFVTTRVLEPGEGLTIYLSWPKGFVKIPSGSEKIIYIFKDNMLLLSSLISGFIIFIYYLIWWFKVGKDPARGTIIPEFSPPENMSPASVRYIYKMGYDNKTFTASIVSMAIKKYLIIKEDNKNFTLVKQKNADINALSEEEQKAAKALFRDNDEITLTHKNNESVSKTLRCHETILKNKYLNVIFNNNKTQAIIGLVLSIILLISSLIAGQHSSSIFIFAWVSIWSIGVSVLLIASGKTWKSLKSKFSISNLIASLFITAFSIPFIGGELFGLKELATNTGAGFIIILLLIIGINILFFYLLKAPTKTGRKIMDKIEGFRMFLETSDREILNRFPDYNVTYEIYEMFLPYAIALDLEHKWQKKFEALLSGITNTHNSKIYWYHNFDNTSSFNQLGSHLSSGISR